MVFLYFEKKKSFDTSLRSYVAYGDRKIVYCVEKMFACL